MIIYIIFCYIRYEGEFFESAWKNKDDAETECQRLNKDRGDKYQYFSVEETPLLERNKE